MALEAELTLEITQALQDIGTIEDALTSVVENFTQAMEDALTALQVPEVEVPVDTSQVDALETQLSSLEANVEPEVENPNAPAQEVQQAFDDTPFVVTPEIDTEALTQSLDDAFAQASAASEGLAGLGEGGEAVGQGLGSAAGGALELQGALSLVREAGGATGRSFGALTTAADALGPAFLPVTAGIAAFTVAGSALVSNARSSVSATERFNLILGDMADEVDNINLGGLNEDLTTLAERLGQDDEALRNAASKVFQIGKTSKLARPDVANLTETVVALAARAGALDPTLSNVGASAQRLFFGLARGGPILARFGIDLPQQELRAFAEQSGKAFASLSIAERAALGAELAMRKLGGTLAADINAGAQNTEIRFRALREEFNNAVEDMGVPLLEPTIEAIRVGQPLLLEIVNVFAELLGAVAPLAAILIEGLTPAFEVLHLAVEPVASVLELLTAVIGELPDDVVAVAAAVGVLTLALTKLGTAATTGKIATGLKTMFASIGADSLAGAAKFGLAVGAMIIAKQLLDRSFEEGEERVTEFVQNIADKFPPAQTSVEELRTGITQMKKAQDDLNKSADKSRSPFDADYRRDLRNGAAALGGYIKAEEEAIVQAKILSVETGLSADSLLKLMRSGQDLTPVIEAASSDFVKFAEALKQNEIDELIAKQKLGAISSEEFTQAIVDTGLSTKELTGILDSAAAATENFVAQFGQPAQDIFDAAFGKLEEGKQTLADLNAQLDKEFAAHISFQANLARLLEEGALDTFEFFSDQGVESAALLEEVIAGGEREIDAFERRREAAKRQREDEERQRVEAARRADIEEGTREAIITKFGIDTTELDEFEADFVQRLFRFEETGGLFGTAVGTTMAEATDRAFKLATDIGLTASALGVGTEQGRIVAENAKAGFEEGATGAFIFTNADREAFNEQGEIAGDAIAAGMVSGLESAGNAIKEAATRVMVNNVLGTLQDAFDFGSPSKVTEELGRLVVEGFNAGLADAEEATGLVDKIISQVDRLKLSAEDLGSVTADSFDGLVEGLDAVAKARDELIASPEGLKQIAESVKALGGAEGVKRLQAAQAMQVSKAFGGIPAEEIAKFAEVLAQQQAVQATAAAVGVAPVIGQPGSTQVVAGPDAASGTPTQISFTIENLNADLPEGATVQEIGTAVADQVVWAARSVTK